MGVKIVLADKEPIGAALRRLKKSLERHNVPGEMRRRAYFIKPTEVRRAKQFQKRLKARLATLSAQMAGEQPSASLLSASLIFWKIRGKSKVARHGV
jgi:ribosomal protein S21